MVLGLARIVVMTILGLIEGYRKNADHIVPWKELINKTFAWLIPVNRLWRKRPIYSFVSFFFHIGLILVPLFLAAHVMLWKKSVGFGWPSLPQNIADILTILVVITAPLLFLMRVFHRGSRALSRSQDYVWPLLLMIPFLTGLICSNGRISASTYSLLMFFHVYSANLIMIMIPFTKIAHCVLMPLSQFVTGLAWKFPAGAGDRVIETLGYKDRPTWVEKPRLGGKSDPTAAQEEV